MCIVDRPSVLREQCNDEEIGIVLEIVHEYRDAYLDLDRETARQLRRYRNRVWKETLAMFPSRQSERMSKTSVQRMVKKAAQIEGVRPYVAGAGRGEPSDVSPHTFRHSIAFRLIRRENKRLEDVMLRLRIVVSRLLTRSTAIFVADEPYITIQSIFSRIPQTRV